MATACAGLASAQQIDGPVQPTAPIPDLRAPSGEAVQLDTFSEAYPPAAELTKRLRGQPADDAFLEVIMAGDGTLYWKRFRKLEKLGGLELHALTASEVGGRFTTYYRFADNDRHRASLICQVRSRPGLDEGIGEATAWCVRQLSMRSGR